MAMRPERSSWSFRRVEPVGNGFSELDQAVKQQAADAEDHNRSHRDLGVGARGCKIDEIAEPGLGGDEFADDDADDCERNRDLHAAEDISQRGGKADARKYLPLVGGERLAKPQHALVDAGKASSGRY